MAKLTKAQRKAKVIENHGLKCEDCGKRNPTVKHTTCPFAEEIHNRIIPMDLCPECEHNRAMDI